MKTNLFKTIAGKAFLSALIGSSAMCAQVTYTFTNASGVGRMGPTQAQINSAYMATNLNGSVVSTGGIQSFTVPTTGVYGFTVAGAKSGDYNNIPLPGNGRKISATYTLNAGTVLQIVVGQKGLAMNNNNPTYIANNNTWNTTNAGGGGGSFVYSGNTLLYAAGGGGAPNGWRNSPGQNGSFSTSGTAGAGGGAGGIGGAPGAAGGAGATAGNNGVGGVGQANTDGPGGGGGGMGVLPSTFLGGATVTPSGSDGGFGGGGSSAGGNAVSAGGGGGGGYSGGGGGGGGSNNDGLGSGGGGGSYGINAIADLGTNGNDGIVIVSLLCNPGATPTNTTLAANQNICMNNTTTLNVTGTGTLNWYSSPASTVVLGTGSVYITPTLAVGNYTYYAASTNSCAEGSRVPVTVTVNASPSVAVAGPTAAVCAGSSVTLTASGAATYSWNNGAVTSTIAPTPTANTSYTVVGTSSAGCSANAVRSVTVNAAPSVSIAGAGTICVGEATVLTASGANTYSWNTGAATTTISVSPTVNTTYTAMGTSSITGCTGIISANIVVSPCTGINQFGTQGTELKIYPNPSGGEFTVELKNGLNKTIQVTDITGRTVLTGTSINDKINVNINYLANGIYYVKVQSNNTVEVIKVVKQ
jgi:hypothetical protein